MFIYLFTSVIINESYIHCIADLQMRTRWSDWYVIYNIYIPKCKATNHEYNFEMMSGGHLGLQPHNSSTIIAIELLFCKMVTLSSYHRYIKTVLYSRAVGPGPILLEPIFKRLDSLTRRFIEVCQMRLISRMTGENRKWYSYNLFLVGIVIYRLIIAGVQYIGLMLWLLLLV